MNWDGVAIGLLAVGDLALIVYLRRRHGRKVRAARMRASLDLAIRREMGQEEKVAEEGLLELAG